MKLIGMIPYGYETMTTVNPPTSNGGSFEPQTLIRAEEMNAELDALVYDLNNIIANLQNVWDKLDTVEEGADAPLSGDEIIDLINTANNEISLSRLNEAISGGDVAVGIENHRTTTTSSKMHPLTSIKGSGNTYTVTPSVYKDTPKNLDEELANIKYAIHKIVGQANWVNTPVENLRMLTEALDVVESKLSGIEAGATKDMTSNEIITAINNATTLINDNKLPSTIARDTEVDAKIAAHTALSNPHNMSKTTIGLSNVDNVKQFAISNVDTTTLSDLTTKVPSSKAVKDYVIDEFTNTLLRKVTTGTEGGQITFESSNSTTYPGAAYMDRHKEMLRIIGEKTVDGTKRAKVVNIPQITYTGADVTSNLFSVTELDNPAQKSISREYWGTAVGAANDTITGPAFITGGMVSRSTTSGYVRWSLNNVAFNDFVTAQFGQVPEGTGVSTTVNNISMGPVPCIYIPAGEKLYLRCGASAPGAGNKLYGGAYVLYYINM